jgi:vacuolar-type H+-ATPase subunit I/STV1
MRVTLIVTGNRGARTPGGRVWSSPATGGLAESSRDGRIVVANHSSGRYRMALSDELTKLAARAKEAQDRAAAAQGKAKADLEQEVEAARASAEEQAGKLRQDAEARKGKLSVWWQDVQRSWSEHIEKVREDMDQRKARHDVDRAEVRAENAEDDAAFAVNFAYAAIEEAEYAVLDASLARMQADEVATAKGGASA